MEFLSKVIPVTLLAFVVSSMLAVGLSLTIKEILVPAPESASLSRSHCWRISS